MGASSATPHRRAGRRTLARAAGALVLAAIATAGLVAGVDRGIRLLGPILIVTAGLAGAVGLKTWWRHLEEEWYAAEVALVSISWALLAAAFAALQFMVFSFAPGSFYVDPEYARRVAPEYRTQWVRDSSRLGEELAQIEVTAEILDLAAPSRLVRDTTYRSDAGAGVRLEEACDEVLPEECRWRLIVSPATGAPPFDLAIERGRDAGGEMGRQKLERELGTMAARVRTDLATLAPRLTDPASWLEPRIGDFLYDTAIAFSGRDSGVFSAIGGLARTFKVLESLASYVLFGIVVSRVAAAAGERLAKSRGVSI